MIRRFALLTSLVVLPSIAFAQRGGGGTQSNKKWELFDKDEGPKGPALRVRDLEDMSPLKLDHRQAKGSQAHRRADRVAQGCREQAQGQERAALQGGRFACIRDMRSGGWRLVGDGSSQDADRAAAACSSTIAERHANYDAAAKEAVATLDAEQQAKANELLAKQREDGEKTVREKMSSGRRRRVGRRPTGRE